MPMNGGGLLPPVESGSPVEDDVDWILSTVLRRNYKKSLTVRRVEFILVSREGGRDRFDDATMVTPQAGDLFVIGAVSSVDGVSFQSGRPNQSYGPLNFQYVDEGIVIN